MAEITGLGIGPSSLLFGCLQTGWASAQSDTTCVLYIRNKMDAEEVWCCLNCSNVSPAQQARPGHNGNVSRIEASR